LKAKATAQARAHNVDSPWFPLLLYNVDFLQHDAAGMARQVGDATGKPGVDDQILFLESETTAYNGEFAKSRKLTRRAAYSDFLSLWKNADPDVPLLKQAKVEFAKLK
jgi:hypothetical protein